MGIFRPFKHLDAILRGEATRLPALQEGKIGIPVASISGAIVLLGILYGLCMGAFGMIRTAGQAYPQFIASAIKLPALFILTLGVSFPSLYVFNALMGSRLSVLSVLRVLVAAIGVMLAVLASLGPIVVFFSVSTTSYHFMVLLNVATCTISGLLGLAFLLRTLERMILVQEMALLPPVRVVPVQAVGEAEDADDQHDAGESDEATGVLDRLVESPSPRAKGVFRVWTCVFALVGAQMSWVLRPFVGDASMPFEVFRAREQNFFIAVFKAVGSLFSG